MKKLLLLLSIVAMRHINGQIIVTVAGNGSLGFSGDGGAATAAKLWGPQSVAFDAAGNLYIADRNNNRVRMVNTSGIISTVAGNGTQGFSGDGGQAIVAQLSNPLGVTCDAIGNLYISDFGNNRIRMVSASGIINTIAGNGTPSFGGDGGAATNAAIYGPGGMVVDATGNIFIADYFNNRIRKINTSGIINTYAGNGISSFSGDGGSATVAELYGPSNVALDGGGNLYIADSYNERVRMVNTSGIINTVAGNGTQGFSGDGASATAAELHQPFGVAIDASGNLYISDRNNNRIRVVNASGTINTIAGNGTLAFSGDGGPATSAAIGYPEGITIDAVGNLYTTDGYSHIRMVNNIMGANNFSAYKKQITIYPNPTSDQFFINANTTDKISVNLYDVNGRHVLSANVSDKENINTTTFNEGVYTMTIQTGDRVINKKLVILR